MLIDWNKPQQETSTQQYSFKGNRGSTLIEVALGKISPVTLPDKPTKYIVKL